MQISRIRLSDEVQAFAHGKFFVSPGSHIKPKCVCSMNALTQLRDEIRTAFDSIPFPAHRGLRAAMAMDDWVTDPARLAEITAQEDVHGEWWQIPAHELRECVLAIAYLDAAGVEFYLPAYMMLALVDAGHTKLWVLDFLNPHIADSDGELSDYFHDRLSRVTGAKRRVCLKFLEFLRQQLDPHDPVWRSEFDAVSRLLEHEFWSA